MRKSKPDPVVRATRVAPASGMTAGTFNLALEIRGWSQRDFARVSGRNERTIRRYAAGVAPVPAWAVEMLK